jgi:hypothetical protein
LDQLAVPPWGGFFLRPSANTPLGRAPFGFQRIAPHGNLTYRATFNHLTPTSLEINIMAKPHRGLKKANHGARPANPE